MAATGMKGGGEMESGKVVVETEDGGSGLDSRSLLAGRGFA